MFKRFRTDRQAKLKLWHYAAGLLILLMAFGVIMPGNWLQQQKDRLLSGSAIQGTWEGSAEGGGTPIDVTISTPNKLEGSSGITCDSVEVYDASFKRIGGDTSNDDTEVTIRGLPQGKNVYVYAQDTLCYPVLVKRTTPAPGPNPSKDTYAMDPVGMPKKASTADVDDYVLYGSTSLGGSNYNFTANGATPTFELKLVATPANCQDEVVGADYMEPVQQKHYGFVVVIRMDREGNRVLSPGWTKIPGITYNYWYKQFDPWEIDYLPDGTYSSTTWSESVQFEFTDSNGDSATVVVTWYDEQCLEDLAKLDFATAFDSASITLQD